MSNPIDDYLEFKKEAVLSGALRGIGRGLSKLTAEDVGARMGEGALTVAGGMAATGLGVAAKKIMGAITKRRDFNEMMTLNDDLKSYQNRDPKTFNAAYSSLRRMNPTFAGDPVVAGAHMRKMMENPDAAGLTLVSTFDKPKPPKGFF